MGRIRAKLHARDPHCHWCARLTLLVIDMDAQDKRPNLATVDHLYERRCGLGRDTSTYGPGVKRWVLACARCNGDRGTTHSRRLNEALGTDRCRARAELGHRIKRSLSWKALLYGWRPLDLGDIMDTVRESTPNAAHLAAV